MVGVSIMSMDHKFARISRDDAKSSGRELDREKQRARSEKLGSAAPHSTT